VKEKINVLLNVKRIVANGIGHILRRNCLQEHIIEGKTEETGRLGRRGNLLLDNFTEKRLYWQLKEKN
jgi:ribosomal protein L35